MTDRTFHEFEGFQAAADERNSMLYWYPKIQGVATTPETIIIQIDTRHYFRIMCEEDGIPEGDFAKFYAAAEKIGYPVFMRTSQSSSKHQWKDTCFVPTKEKLRRNLFMLLEHDFMSDLVPNAIVFRKYIPMESYFTAWSGDFPVNKEIRCFINKGKLECIHPYWFEDAVQQGEYWITDKDWKSKMSLITEISIQDRQAIEAQLHKVIPLFGDEWWSVDFAKSKDGVWYLIDMACGLASYHYKGCEFEPKFVKGNRT